MTTKLIRLPDDLKARVAEAEKWAGVAEKAEPRAEFAALAEQRYARIVESGNTISWSEMRCYLEGRVAGNVAKRPAARKLAK